MVIRSSWKEAASGADRSVNCAVYVTNKYLHDPADQIVDRDIALKAMQRQLEHTCDERRTPLARI
jgi:hypothetical protein